MTNYIPQVDYTSRDYAAIRKDLIDLIEDYAPLWTNRDPSDFGMTILENFAYMGDILNYYIDKSANEAFISTASQRDSVLQIAKLLGYKPTESTAAKVTLSFSNSTAGAITVPALTQVATSTVSNSTTNQIIFETDTALTVPAGSTGTTVTATQGVTVPSASIGTSNGTVNQSFKLIKTPVITGSISLTVGGVSYTEVPYLIDYNSYDPVFSTYTNAAGVTFVVFGDGISGRVPPNNAVVLASYRIGGGTEGNVAANTIKSIITTAGITPSSAGLSVLNKYLSALDDGSGKGGADPEATDSIRINAPLSVRSLNRAVSLSDYSALAVQVSRVAKAIAIADVYSSVTLFFAPVGDRGVESDGVTPTATFNTIKAAIESYLIDKIPANTTVTYQPPSYVTVYVTAAITCLPQYKQTIIQANVNSILTELFAFNNVAFADRITLQDVMSAIASVEGVAYSQISKLVRKDADITKTITNKALTSNVATLTANAHGLNVGQTIKVTDVDSTFNGVYVVTAKTTNTFSYVCIATDVVSVAVTGTASVTALTVTDIICATNEIPESNYATDISLTLSGGILS
jgi:hypothetical protein